MKLIQLTQGYSAMVDDDDYDHLMQLKWQVIHDKHTSYAKTHIKNQETGKRDTIRMHRVIMNVISPDILVDHKDRNGLNCQKNNLRTCNKSENCKNRKSHDNATSKFLGVSWHKRVRKFAATIQDKSAGKCKHLGYFKNDSDAAKAYDNAAREIHGEFANLNFKDQ